MLDKSIFRKKGFALVHGLCIQLIVAGKVWQQQQLQLWQQEHGTAVVRKQKQMPVLSSLSYCYSTRDPDLGDGVTQSYSEPSSTSLIYKLPHVHDQRFVSYMILILWR